MNKLREFKIQDRITQKNKVVDKYLTDITKIPLLTRDEEHELAMKMVNGDISAKNKIIKANLRFVVSVAKSFTTSDKVPLEDLISQGNLGLIEAADNYDPTTGFKFISYAVWNIRKYIYMYLNDHSRTIRIPTNIITGLNRARRVENKLMHENDREVTLDEISIILEDIEKPTTAHRLAKMIEYASTSVPLEKSQYDDSEFDNSPITYLDSEESPEKLTDDFDKKVIFEELFRGLTQIELMLVTKRLGLIDGTISSYKELALECNYSAERLRQKYGIALKKIKQLAIKLKWVPANYNPKHFWTRK